MSSTDAGGLTTVAGYNSLGFAQATLMPNADPLKEDILLHRIDAVDVFGNTVKETLGNGVISRTEHDRTTGKLLTMTAHKGNTLLQKNTYVSDNFGNIHGRTRHAAQGLDTKVEAFTFDGVERLTASTVNGTSVGGVTLTYDDFGNILTKSGVGTYNYDTVKKNRLLSIDREGGPNNGRTQRFFYDAAGRVSSDQMEDGSGNVVGRKRTFGYTPFGQIAYISAERGTALTTSPGNFGEWGRTDIAFQFSAGGGRLRQIKDQTQMAGDMTQPEALRTTTTYLGSFESRPWRGRRWTARNEQPLGARRAWGASESNGIRAGRCPQQHANL